MNSRSTAPGAPPAPILEARARFGAGRFADAEAILRDFIAKNPGIPEALELLGACLGAQERHAEALEWMEGALRLRPPSAAALHNRAQALLALARPGEARRDLEQALALKPGFAPAWTALGRALAALGDAPGAERAYRQPVHLDPGSPEAFYNLARFCHDAGRLDEAIAGYRKALALNPRLAVAHNSLANALRAKGDAAGALEHFGEAARLAPDLVEASANYAEALREAGRGAEALAILERAALAHPHSPHILNSLGVAHYARNRFAEAEQCYRRALALAPRMDEAQINLGNALGAQGHAPESIACYRAVIERSPGNADALSNLGIAVQEQDEVDEAMDAYTRALAIRPDHSDALNNLGFLLEQQGRRADAMALYRKALDTNARFARAAYNLSLAKLANFEFREGWALSDPSRFQIVPPVAIPRPFAIPRFEAADWQRTRKLAVWREQGVGDQILYATTIPELEARGMPFVLEADPRLIPAFRRAHPRWDVVAPEASQASFRSCDRHIPIGSLPALFRDTRESFDRQPAALLAADTARAALMRQQLEVKDARLIGVSWRSFQPKVRGYLERRKSAPLAAFLGLSAHDHVRLLDLQYGDTFAERDEFAKAGGRLDRVDGLDLFTDLDGVLAAIEACDLVITTSNVTAHLAGSIGKRTFLLYPAAIAPFHYWSSDASGRCLWYPSVVIVTAPELRSWTDLLRRMIERLDADHA